MIELTRGLRLHRNLHHDGRRYDPVYLVIRPFFPLQGRPAVVSINTPHRISHRRPLRQAQGSAFDYPSTSSGQGSGNGSASATPPQGGSDCDGITCGTHARIYPYPAYHNSRCRALTRYGRRQNVVIELVEMPAFRSLFGVLRRPFDPSTGSGTTSSGSGSGLEQRFLTKPKGLRSCDAMADSEVASGC